MKRVKRPTPTLLPTTSKRTMLQLFPNIAFKLLKTLQATLKMMIAFWWRNHNI
jgi:hypothetical protein